MNGNLGGGATGIGLKCFVEAKSFGGGVLTGRKKIGDRGESEGGRGGFCELHRQRGKAQAKLVLACLGVNAMPGYGLFLLFVQALDLLLSLSLSLSLYLPLSLAFSVSLSFSLSLSQYISLFLSRFLPVSPPSISLLCLSLALFLLPSPSFSIFSISYFLFLSRQG